ncbi:Interleukin-28B [Heterocephalus glaber]|uniref:Interleukin-28B n=1 Tax=Heterocephalus glaber TaxID=10181 RepID=G5C2T3_HETGA|nr:Interleukin-28B [Heterocephalus glaber]
MQPSGRAAVAAVAAGLWVMCMLVMAENLRVAEDRGMVAPRHCLLSHYHSLEPRALAAVKALRDSYVSEPPPPWHGEPSPDPPALETRGPVLRDTVSSARKAQLLSRAPEFCVPLEARSRLCAREERAPQGTQLRVGAQGLAQGWQGADPAGGCVLLLLLLLCTVQTRSGEVPVPRPLSVSPDARGCHVAQLQSLSLEERQAFKTAKEALVWERPMALQAELSLTLKVLASVTDQALWGIVKQPIHTLRHIHAQLRACVPAQPKAAHRPCSHRLSRWLQRLNQATKKESPGCLQASVISNLFFLLTRDLRCVARPDLCA